jgi:hypothetical protein
MLHLLATGANAQNIRLGASTAIRRSGLPMRLVRRAAKFTAWRLSQTKVDHAREQLARCGLGAFVDFMSAARSTRCRI